MKRFVQNSNSCRITHAVSYFITYDELISLLLWQIVRFGQWEQFIIGNKVANWRSYTTRIRILHEAFY
jgi:hypothetical protein